jgi:hypothetical protein
MVLGNNMSDIFESYVDWSLNKTYGELSYDETEWMPSETVAPKNVAQPEATKPSAITRAVGAGLETLQRETESNPIGSAYGTAKGAVQGTIGSVGDLVSIVRGVVDAVNTPEGKSKIEAFLSGMEKPTGAPTPEDVANFLNQYIPSGTASGETVGELVGLGGAIKKPIKQMAKIMSKAKAKQ